MKKTLRLLSMTVLAMFASTAMAQTTFDFDTEGKTLLGLAGESANGVNDGDITETKTATLDGISVAVSANPEEKISTPNRLWSTTPKLRLYAGTVTITAPTGKNISSVKFQLNTKASSVKWGAENKINNVAAPLGENATEVTWSGSAASVVLTISGGTKDDGTPISGNTQISSITVALDGQEIIDPEPVEVDNIAAFLALPENTVAKLKLKDAKVLYTWTSNVGNVHTFVRDESGAIQFFNDGLGLKANQILNGTVVLQYALYQKTTPEAISVTGKTNADNLTITDGEAAEPVEISTSDVANYMNDLVTIEGDFEEGEGGYFIDDVQIYNGFHVAEYEKGEEEDAVDPLSKFVGGYGKVTGIVSAFTKTVDETEVTTYEIKVIEGGIDVTVENGIESINTTTVSANAPMYNVAGQRVSKNYKGVVLQNGKKFLNK